MRRLAIADYKTANQYLAQTYLPEHNARFAVTPADPIDMHEALQRKLDLNTVFCLEHRRTVGNDWVVRFENQLLQIAPDQVAAGMIVKIQHHREPEAFGNRYQSAIL